MINALNAFSLNVFQKESGKNAVTEANPLITALEKENPEKADELKKKLEESQNLLNSLESSKQDINEERKAAAAEKVANIKKKLEALRLLVAVNPEAAARQAKQLSNELKQAVQEYASGSRAANGIITTTGTENTSLTNVSIQSDAVATYNNISPTPQAVENTKETNDAQPEDVPVAIAESTIRLTLEEIKKKEEEDKEIFQENIQKQISEMNETFSKSQANREFAMMVNDVKNTLKSIIEAIKKKLELEDYPLAEQDIKDAERALSAVDKSVAEITSSGVADSFVNIMT